MGISSSLGSVSPVVDEEELMVTPEDTLVVDVVALVWSPGSKVLALEPVGAWISVDWSPVIGPEVVESMPEMGIVWSASKI